MNESLQKHFKSIQNSLLCKQCHILFKDPIQLRCGCIVCSECVANIKTCCRKKVTARDCTNKHQLVTDVNRLLKVVGDLFHDQAGNDVELCQSPKATKLSDTCDEEKQATSEKEEEETILLLDKIDSIHGHDTNPVQTDNVSQSHLRSDNSSPEECKPPLLRHSSSVSTIDGAIKHHPPLSSHPQSSPPLLLQPNKAAAKDDVSCLPSAPSQAVSDVFLNTQKTSQGAFVWETQTQTPEEQVDQDGGLSGGAYPTVVPDSLLETFEPLPATESCSFRMPPRIMQPRDARLYQHEEEDLMLTTSTTTLSPTQIVDYDDEEQSPSAQQEGGGGGEEGAVVVVPDTLAVEEQEQEGTLLFPSPFPSQDRGVISSSMHMDVSTNMNISTGMNEMKNVKHSRAEGVQGGSRRQEVVTDTYVASNRVSHQHSRATASYEQHPHRRADAGSRKQLEPHQEHVVCDTYQVREEGHTSSLGATATDKRPTGILNSSPHSEMTESSLYNVDSYIEQYAGTGQSSNLTMGGKESRSVPLPSAAPGDKDRDRDREGKKEKEKEKERDQDDRLGGRDGESRGRVVLSTLESDWLDDQEDPDPDALDTLAPQSLTQGYSGGEAVLRDNGEGGGEGKTSSCSLLSPSAQSNVHLDLSIDFDIHNQPDRSIDRSSSSRPLKQRDSTSSTRLPIHLPVPIAEASMSTISGSAGSPGAAGTGELLLRPLPAETRKGSSNSNRDNRDEDDAKMKEEDENTDSDAAALYEVASDISDSETEGGVRTCAMKDRGALLTDQPQPRVNLGSGGGGKTEGSWLPPLSTAALTAAAEAASRCNTPPLLSSYNSSNSTGAGTFNSVADSYGSPDMATWAEEDNKLLKGLLKRIPDRHSTAQDNGGRGQSRQRAVHPPPPPTTDALISLLESQASDSQGDGWIDSKQQHEEKEKEKEKDVTYRPPASPASPPPTTIPHFSIIYSSSLLFGETKSLQAQCEQRGLFTAVKNNWWVLGDQKPLPASSTAQTMTSPQAPPTAHLVLLEAEACAHFVKKRESSLNTAPVTHTTTVGGGVYQCARTLSFLKGLCLGYWLIDGPRWLRACLLEGQVADLARFEVALCRGAPPCAAPTRARLAPREVDSAQPDGHSRSKLFEHCTFLLKRPTANSSSSSSSSAAIVGLGSGDISFMLYSGGGAVHTFPRGADSACLCDACDRHNNSSPPSQSMSTSSVIVLNLLKDDLNKIVGAKRKKKDGAREGGGGSVIAKCYLCHKTVSSASISASSSLAPHLKSFPEVGLQWLLDSICTFDKKTT